jgi:signal transduction histidine kinase
MENVSFTVDAGLINRLGLELVGRAETAVSELIKNAYDADANYVELDFIETIQAGGTLVITDDGNGMTKDQLIQGFMRISSGDKVDNPISPKYKRSRAGKKGIGRFATQRLGKRLILTTQTRESQSSLKITIEWDMYETHKELITISHPIEEIPKERSQGTTLRIENLREAWSEATIKRIFRYTSELIQPNYLSDTAKSLRESNDSFEPIFYQTVGLERNKIADVQELIFDFAIATIEGYVGTDKIGYCNVSSKRFELDEITEISAEGNKNEEIISFQLLENIHFKTYYFIYNRTEYYRDGISKMLLNQIKDFAEERSGLRLYRNGFRVLPYGEPNDDWLDLDRRWSTQSAAITIPFGNKNLFGFIEIVDKQGRLFEETASREGLIENDALKELKYFLKQSLKWSRGKIAASIEFRKARDKWVNKQEDKRSVPQKLEDITKRIQSLGEYINKGIHENGNTLIINEQKELLENTLAELRKTTISIEEDVNAQIEDLAMMRVLAGLGLVIAEFVHELQQFSPAFNGGLSFLSRQNLDEQSKEVTLNLQKSFNRFKTYTSYFDKAISRNVQRELEPINIKMAINEFINTIKPDAESNRIAVDKDFKGFDLYTCPMHPSEWSSVFFNFYSNSKKAIFRVQSEGKILITAEEDKSKICIEFMDNGDGIKENIQERMFEAFVTISQPVTDDVGEGLTGTGLGLKIVKDIIRAYDGEVYVSLPKEGYNTCIRIEIPKATKTQLEKYGY